MTLEEIQRALRDRRINIVAEETGLHYNTIRNIRDGKNTNPTYFVVSALTNYLKEEKDYK